MALETVFSDRAMVVTSHPLAVDAGLETLKHGGSAADAAVAAAAVLTLVDPRATGIGGDALALYWRQGSERPEALAAAGPAPAATTVESLRRAGFDSMPTEGPWTVTVPGSVAGWDALLSIHGTLGLDRVLHRAITIAHEGFEVSPFVAEEWMMGVPKLEKHETARSTFLPSGRAPLSGERFANADLGRTLEALGERGPAYFYEGELAGRIADTVQAAGGPMRAEDLAEWSGPEWVEPITGRYRDVDVFEFPPPGQGIAVLQAAALYTGFDPRDRVDEEHFAIESMKLALADAAAYVADPSVEDVPVRTLLSDRYLVSRRASIDSSAALDATRGNTSDTVYVAVVDKDGHACSFIQSLYNGFGSGLVVPGTGVALHNRGAGFVLEDGHPNRPAPGKRPYHTIIPAMLGGSGAFDAEIVGALEERGHQVSQLSRFEAGGAQVIVRDDSRLLGGSDPRKDGCA